MPGEPTRQPPLPTETGRENNQALVRCGGGQNLARSGIDVDSPIRYFARFTISTSQQYAVVKFGLHRSWTSNTDFNARSAASSRRARLNPMLKRLQVRYVVVDLLNHIDQPMQIYTRGVDRS